MLETWALSLGLEVPLEEQMATHSSVLAWEIPWTVDPSGLESDKESQRVRQDCVHMLYIDRINRGIWIDVGAFPMTRQVKNLPAMQEIQEMQVQSLGQEDPLKEEMATHSSILA